MTRMFSESQVKVLLILLDDNGHPGWELAEHIEMKESNLNPVLRNLEKKGIIFEGTCRITERPKGEPGTKIKNPRYRRPKTRNGEYKEIPYYLNKSLEALRTIIRELKGKKYPHIDAGFIIYIISKSKYLEVMITKFGEQVNKCATEEINKVFPFTDDDFYSEIVEDIIPKDLSNFKERPLLRGEASTLFKAKPELRSVFWRERSNTEIWYDNYLRSISADHENNDI